MALFIRDNYAQFSRITLADKDKMIMTIQNNKNKNNNKI